MLAYHDSDCLAIKEPVDLSKEDPEVDLSCNCTMSGKGRGPIADGEIEFNFVGERVGADTTGLYQIVGGERHDLRIDSLDALTLLLAASQAGQERSPLAKEVADTHAYLNLVGAPSRGTELPDTKLNLIGRIRGYEEKLKKKANG